MRARTATLAAAFLLFAVVALSSCGQWLTTGSWTLGGNPTRPEDPPALAQRTSIHIRVQVPGNGTEISQGSLVQAKVTGRKLSTGESVPGAYFGKFSDVWFWIGNAIHSRDEVLPILHLGSNGLRAAFIGTREGSKVIVTFDSLLIRDSWILPKRGFMLDNTKEYRFSVGTDHDYERFSQPASTSLRS